MPGIASSNYARIAIMQKTASHRKTALVLSGFVLLLISCNLGTSDNKPAHAGAHARCDAASHPGLCGSAPGRLARNRRHRPAPKGETPCASLLDQVEADRLLSHIRSLQDLRTRHISSTQSSASEGIGAARRYINDQFEVIRAASGGKFYTFEVGFYGLHGGGGNAARNTISSAQSAAAN